MKVLFDIVHPAHLNFFKNSINILHKNNIDIIVTCLDRGKLKLIVQRELSEHKIIILGKHRGSKVSIIFEANIFRFFNMFLLLIKEKPDLCFSVGSFVLGFAAKILFKINYQFDDDPERRFNLILEKMSARTVFFPPIINESRKIKNFYALKEWSYLSPEYFDPEESALMKYKIVSKRYIFIREIDNATFNYSGQDKAITSVLSNVIPAQIKVLLSLENKNDRYLYPDNWIVLEEPVDDIHSLMFYSKLVISSGDSMAREGAMLGVPSVYCGFREMKSNDFISKDTNFYSVTGKYLSILVSKLVTEELSMRDQYQIRNNLQNKWNNVTELICKLTYEQL